MTSKYAPEYKLAVAICQRPFRVRVFHCGLMGSRFGVRYMKARIYSWGSENNVCSSSGIGAYSTLSPKLYQINVLSPDENWLSPVARLTVLWTSTRGYGRNRHSEPSPSTLVSMMDPPLGGSLLISAWIVRRSDVVGGYLNKS